MTPPYKKILGIAVLLILIAWFGIYLNNNINEFKQLKLENPIYVIAIIFLFLVNSVFISIINKNLFLPLGVKLRNLEALGITFISSFYNLITPFRGGIAARAIYLKKKHNFKYIDFLATLSGLYIITFLIASLIGIISILAINFIYGIFSWLILFIFLIFFIPLLFIVLLSPRFPETKNKFINRFIRVINGWNLIRKNKRAVLIVSMVTLMQLLIGAYSIYLAFQVFGIQVEYIKCLFLASIGSLAILISITPAGLGIQEAITVFSALTIGITPTQSLSVALLGRAIQIIILFILGPIFSYILLKRKPKQGEK